ncbi:hypothetical protein Tco_0226944, partial [Tanacetum coccineum]
HGRTFNWQTATFGKVENYEDEDDCFINFETEFPAIVFDNTLTALPSEPTVCPPNKNKIDFRISLDESDDEDYTVIFDENSFSYKIISVNDLKSDSGNDNDNMPSSPNLTVDYVDDLDVLKDFENEFPAIVYNDAQTSKSDYLTKPILNPQHIDEFNLNDETSLSEYDEDEQNVWHFNDLFLFDIIHPDDLKLEKDNDDNDIDIIQCSKGNEITHRLNGLSETSHDKIIKTFRMGSFVINCDLELLHKRHAVLSHYKFILTHDMAPLPAADQRHPWIRYQVEGYTEGTRHIYEQRLETIWSRPVNRVHVLDFEGLTPEMRQDLAVRLRMVYTGERGSRMSDTEMGLDVADTLCFYMDRGTTNVLHLLAQYLFRHAEGRKSGVRLLGGHFIGRLAMHFGLGPERQQAAAAGAHGVDEAGLTTEEGAQEIPAHAPPPLPPTP